MGATSELIIRLQDSIISEVQLAENGEVGFAETFKNLYKHKKNIEDCLGIIKEFQDDNFENIANENDPNIEVRNGGVMYNYKGIKEWEKKRAELKEIEDRSKQAYIAKQKGLLTASEDGEEIELPSISYRKSSIILKKPQHDN